mgnify:CR=1 FL=1
MANGYESNIPTGRPPAVTAWGTQVVAGTSHVLSSSFVEIIASTSFAAERVRVTISNTGAANTNTDALLNLYTGAVSSETNWIMGLMAGWSGTVSTQKIFDFPVSLPAGTRIIAKSQALVGSQSLYVWIELFEEGKAFGNAVESLGVDTTNSRGTSVTPGGAAEGSATAIGTSANAWNYVLVGVQGNADTSLLDNTQALDICVGGTPVTNCSDFYQLNSTVELNNVITPGRNCSIAASTALQLRGQSSDATVEAKYYALYGIYGTGTQAPAPGNMSGGMQ